MGAVLTRRNIPLSLQKSTVKLKSKIGRLDSLMLEFSTTLDLRSQSPQWVIALGNFDGVHLGHQALLRELKRVSISSSCPQAVITFEPHPREYFYRLQNPKEPWPRIWGSWDLRQELASWRIDALVEQRFDRVFSQLGAESFLEEFIAPLAPKALVIGHDFAFGKNRQGSIQDLCAFGRRMNCEIVVVEPVTVAERRVSTTQIKNLLGIPDLSQAEEFLGRKPSLGGRVQHGQQRGRQLGVPTANILLRHYPALARGVYAVKVHRMAERSSFFGVANLGLNPTVSDTSETKFEVHLLDFSGDLYGQDLQVEFFLFLRAEKKFTNLNELQTQIFSDCSRAREYFA